MKMLYPRGSVSVWWRPGERLVPRRRAVVFLAVGLVGAAAAIAALVWALSGPWPFVLPRFHAVQFLLFAAAVFLLGYVGLGVLALLEPRWFRGAVVRWVRHRRLLRAGERAPGDPLAQWLSHRLDERGARRVTALGARLSWATPAAVGAALITAAAIISLHATGHIVPAWLWRLAHVFFQSGAWTPTLLLLATLAPLLLGHWLRSVGRAAQRRGESGRRQARGSPSNRSPAA